MKNNKDYSAHFHFPVEDMNKKNLIKARILRINGLNKQKQDAIERILQFLYLTKFDKAIFRSTIKANQGHLSDVERILAYRLETRCSGSEKENYGINAVLAIKRDKYKCKICGERDVRCLDIDHIPEKFDHKGKKTRSDFAVKEFQCLCANHHRIKTVNQNDAKSKVNKG